MKICTSNNNLFNSFSWLFEIFITLYISYILTKIIRSKLKLMHKDYLDIILLGICFIQTFFLILELVFKSNFFFDFFVFLSKFQLATLITGCLYFQMLIHKAKFAVRYLKYYITGVLIFEIIVLFLFFYELIFSESALFCYNYLYLILSGFGVFFSGAVIMYLIYNSINNRFQENSNTFNLLCDEFYHMNMHVKKQLKVISKNQKYYIIILIVCIISSLLDLISMFAGKNERKIFNEINKLENTPNIGNGYLSDSSVSQISSLAYTDSIDSDSKFSSDSESDSNTQINNFVANNSSVKYNQTSKDTNLSYSSCSIIKEINDTLDILFCLSLYIIKELLISVIIILILIIKPSNNETSQAFIELI
jgi:hypothetical protein